MGIDMLFNPLLDDKYEVIFPLDGNEFQEGPPVIISPDLAGIHYIVPGKDVQNMYVIDKEQVIHRVFPPGINRDNTGNSEYVQEYIENKDLIDRAIGLLIQKLNISSATEIILDRVVRYSNEFNGHIPDLERLLPNGEDSLGDGTYFHEGLPVIRVYIRNLKELIPCGCCHYKGEIMLEETPPDILSTQWHLVD